MSELSPDERLQIAAMLMLWAFNPPNYKRHNVVRVPNGKEDKMTELADKYLFRETNAYIPEELNDERMAVAAYIGVFPTAENTTNAMKALAEFTVDGTSLFVE